MHPLFLVWLRSYHRSRHYSLFKDAVGGRSDRAPRPPAGAWPQAVDEFAAERAKLPPSVITVDFSAGRLNDQN